MWGFPTSLNDVIISPEVHLRAELRAGEGELADGIGIQRAFMVPLICYFDIAFFWYVTRNRTVAEAAVGDPV